MLGRGSTIVVWMIAACGRLGFDAGDDATMGVAVSARRGACTIPVDATTVACPIAPPHQDLARTVLVFQATGDDGTPAGFDVRCTLTATDTITCDRQGTTGSATIAWQTVERASGLTVQHARFTCDQLFTYTQPIAPVDPASAFVFGSWTQQGSFLNDDDFLTLELSATSIVVSTGSTDSCGISGVGPMQGALDVIELPGATVTRGTVGPMASGAGSLLVANLPAVDLATTALWITYRSASNDVPVCELVVRGELTSPTTIALSRGLGDPACVDSPIEAIAWQRVDFHGLATVEPFTVDLAEAVTAVTVPTATVDPTRAVVSSTAQGVDGQGTGEGGFSTSGRGGEVAATMTLGPDGVVVTRAAATSQARFTGQIIRWTP